MKVFISWSGELSKELGESFRDWLPSVLQSVKPFFTPSDIEKGARWGKEISSELEDSSIGIFCITRENLSKPWLMFEAGALSKKIDSSKVCPILFGVETTDLEGPLVQFQASEFKETEIKKVVNTINSSLGENKLSDSVLDSVFEMWWPKLNEEVQKILKKHEDVGGTHPTRDDREILDEILELSRLTARTSRASSHKRIAHGSIEDIIDTWSQVIVAIDEKESTNDILELTRDFTKPVQYLIGKTSIPKTEREDMQDRVDAIVEFISDTINEVE